MEFRASLTGECDLWIVSGETGAEFKVTPTWGKDTEGLRPCRAGATTAANRHGCNARPAAAH